MRVSVAFSKLCVHAARWTWGALALVGVSITTVGCARRDLPQPNAVSRGSEQRAARDDARVVEAVAGATAQARADVVPTSNEPRALVSVMLDAAMPRADDAANLVPSPPPQQRPMDASVIARAESPADTSDPFARAPTGHEGPGSGASNGEASHYVAFEGSWRVTGFADGGAKG